MANKNAYLKQIANKNYNFMLLCFQNWFAVVEPNTFLFLDSRVNGHWQTLPACVLCRSGRQH